MPMTHRSPIQTRSAHALAGRLRGSVTVELALGCTLLVPLLVIGADLGQSVGQYNTLVKAATDAARHLSVADPSRTGVVAEATNLAVYGALSASDGNQQSRSPLVPGLSTSQVTICTPQNCAQTHADQPTDLGTTRLDLVTVTLRDVQLGGVVTSIVPTMTIPSISVTLTQPR